MKQKTIFEQLGGTYIQKGDYLLPNLKMPKQPEYNIGVNSRSITSAYGDSAAGVISKSIVQFSIPTCLHLASCPNI